jgi:2-polyprenyl-3-methyl-5-hydroxy-6-metoxy-1,4-benzoquinol methylase
MKEVISPITHSKNVSLDIEISVNDIKQLYKDAIGMDISAYFKGLDKIQIYKCNDSSYRFYYPRTIEGDGAFYADLQNKFSEKGGYYRPWTFDHEFANDLIMHGNEVFEIGCGTGLFMKKIQERGINISGLELNNKAVEECKKLGLTVENELVSEHSKLNSEKYDVICAFQVLEHVTEVKEFLDDTLKCLKKGGKLIIGVPCSDPYYMRHNKYETFNLPPHHMGLWNLNTFKNLEPLFGLKLIKHTFTNAPSLKGDAYFRAKKWGNIKTSLSNHTLLEKCLIGLLLPFSLLSSCFDFSTKSINGTYIVVLFEKKI